MEAARQMRILESARFPAAQTICSVRDAFCCCREILLARLLLPARALSRNSQLLDSAKRFLVCFAFRFGGRLFVQTAI